MIKQLITNRILLSQKCLKADIDSEDLPGLIQDLIDTAESHKENCAGLAFNQIGKYIRGFVIRAGDDYKVFINPEYVMRGGGIKSLFESCLSKPNEDPVKKRRHKKIKIKFYDPETKQENTLTFNQFGARVVQHEMDHLDGILI